MRCVEIMLESGEKRWQCVADGPPHPATGKRRQVVRRDKRQSVAKEKVRKAIRQMKFEGVNPQEANALVFSEVAERWYRNYSFTGIKKSTLNKKRKEISHLEKYMSDWVINKITHDMYQEVIFKLAEQYARTSVSGIHSAARMIFKFAKKRSWIREDPTLDIIIPKKPKTVDEIKQENIEEEYLDHHEIEEFLSAAVKYGLKHDKERFYTLAFSGLRPGELCALQKQDLLFDTNQIDVIKTIYSETNNMKDYELTTPKTPGSIRRVEIEPFIMQMLRKVVLENDKNKLKHKKLIEDYHDENFVFARDNGYPFYTIALNNRMHRLLKKTSIKKKATPHIFRHTHISMLTEAGVDLDTIMDRVGHEDSATTKKIYTHVTSKMRKEAPVKLTKIYGDVLEKIAFIK